MKRSSRERKRRTRALRQDRKRFWSLVAEFAAMFRAGREPDMSRWGLWGYIAREEARDRVFGPPKPLAFEDVMAWARDVV
jgi:hypothetical protein